MHIFSQNTHTQKIAHKLFCLYCKKANKPPVCCICTVVVNSRESTHGRGHSKQHKHKTLRIFLLYLFYTTLYYMFLTNKAVIYFLLIVFFKCEKCAVLSADVNPDVRSVFTSYHSLILGRHLGFLLPC